MQLTVEQKAIVAEAKRTKGNIKIQAYAGAAKTTTLRLVSEAMPRKSFLYVAFNKSIQEDAQKSFPDNVVARTAHSLAYGQTRMFEENWKTKLNMRIKTKDYIPLLDLPPDTKFVFINAILDTVKKFEYSDSRILTTEHVPYDVIKTAKAKIENLFPYVEEISKEEIDAEREKKLEDLKDRIAGYAKNLWDMKIIETNLKVPIQHDTYLKMWQLSDPVIRGYDVILFDEAQDANPVILNIVTQQKHMQLYTVGDSFQSIYAFRGATNAMDIIPADSEHYLTKSFRFGKRIADVAAAVLRHRNLKKPIVGFEKVTSTLGKVDQKKKFTVIFRTNAGLLREALDLSDKGVLAAVVGKIDGAISKIRSAYYMYDDKKDKVIDAEIKQFENWDELVDVAKKTENFEMQTIIDFVIEYTEDVPHLLRKLEESCTFSEKNAKVILTTGHKAKGREFDQVIIGQDFARRFEGKEGGLKKPEDVHPQEINLLYVALTRAIKRLEIPTTLKNYLASQGLK